MALVVAVAVAVLRAVTKLVRVSLGTSPLGGQGWPYHRGPRSHGWSAGSLGGAWTQLKAAEVEKPVQEMVIALIVVAVLTWLMLVAAPVAALLAALVVLHMELVMMI